MQKKIYSVVLIIFVVMISVAVMIIPTFFTKDISRVSLNKQIDLPLILDDTKEIKLVFFGYSGCTKICTPRLYSLATFFNTLPQNIKKRVGVEFVDISSPDDKELPQMFAHSFNKEFKGIYLDQKILRNYTKEFDVYFSRSLLDKTEFDHTANLYLLKKSNNKKEIRYIYSSYPYDYKQIRSDIEELLNE